MNQKTRKKLIRDLVIDGSFMCMLVIAMSNFALVLTFSAQGSGDKLIGAFGIILSALLGAFFTTRVLEHLRALTKR